MANLAGATLVAQFDDAVTRGVETGLETIDFDEQDGLGVERKAKMIGFFNRSDDALVHHLERRRHDAVPDDFADRVGCVLDRVEHGKHRAIALWVARDADPDFGHNGECAFAAYDRADEGLGRVTLTQGIVVLTTMVN